MANEVYANGREVSCKAGSGKTICAFPDVCFTPPENPATPPGVPIPYPNTGMTSDTTSGSTTVKISGEEVMLKNKSYFKKSSGDEAGCAAKKGVLTSVNRGKVYFTAWSMDVKIEGENVVRHLDLTTHNHNPSVGQTPPWPFIDSQALAPDAPCYDDKRAKDEACAGEPEPCCPGVLSRPPEELRAQVKLAPSKRADDVRRLDATPKGDESGKSKAARAATKEAQSNECVKRSRCQLKPYSPKQGEPACCPGQTPHHIPPKNCFDRLQNYDEGSALCVCMEGTSQHVGSHGKNHAAIDYLAKKNGIEPGGQVSIAEYNTICAQTVEAQCGCQADCIKAQLDESLKPTNRKIEHWHSTSKQLDPALQTELDAAYKAKPAVSASR